MHLLRDGSFLYLSEYLYSSLEGKTPNQDLMYVSRETFSGSPLGSKSYDKVRTATTSIYIEAKNQYDQEYSEGVPEVIRIKHFKDNFYFGFINKFNKDIDFANAVDRTYKQMQVSGLFENNQLRFIDTCCMGTMPLLMESITRKYHPEVQTETYLMYVEYSGFGFMSADMPGGLKVELTRQKGVYGAFENDLPVLRPSTKMELSINYMSELLTAKTTIDYYNSLQTPAKQG